AVHQPSAHFSRAAVDEPPGTDKDEKSGAVTVAVPPPAAMGGNGNGKAVVGQFLPAGGGAAAGASVAAPVIAGKTILITGGAGFIGSSLAEKLVDHNRVILLDHSFGPAPIQYTSLLRHPNVTRVPGDILSVD